MCRKDVFDVKIQYLNSLSLVQPLNQGNPARIQILISFRPYRNIGVARHTFIIHVDVTFFTFLAVTHFLGSVPFLLLISSLIEETRLSAFKLKVAVAIFTGNLSARLINDVRGFGVCLNLKDESLYKNRSWIWGSK